MCLSYLKKLVQAIREAMAEQNNEKSELEKRNEETENIYNELTAAGYDISKISDEDLESLREPYRKIRFIEQYLVFPFDTTDNSSAILALTEASTTFHTIASSKCGPQK